jgi:hypothetical protein
VIQSIHISCVAPERANSFVTAMRQSTLYLGLNPSVRLGPIGGDLLRTRFSATAYVSIDSWQSERES